MEWGIIITGFYLVGMVGLMIGSLNADFGTPAPYTQATEQPESFQKAA